MVRKRRAAISALDVEIEGFQGDDPPWPYELAVLHFRVISDAISVTVLKRVVRLSVVRYCSVLATMRGVARIEATVELVDSAGMSSGRRAVRLDVPLARALAEADVPEPTADEEPTARDDEGH